MYVCLWAYTCVFCRCTRPRWCITLVFHRSPSHSRHRRRRRRRHIVVALVVVPLLIIRMMGRHTLELKLRDVSSAGELHASTTPRACRLLDMQKRSHERGAALYVHAPSASSKETAKIRWRIIPPRESARSRRLCQVSDTGIRRSRCRSRARGWREIMLRNKGLKGTLSD